jgi:hypothetical protein
MAVEPAQAQCVLAAIGLTAGVRTQAVVDEAILAALEQRVELARAEPPAALRGPLADLGLGQVAAAAVAQGLVALARAPAAELAAQVRVPGRGPQQARGARVVDATVVDAGRRLGRGVVAGIHLAEAEQAFEALTGRGLPAQAALQAVAAPVVAVGGVAGVVQDLARVEAVGALGGRAQRVVEVLVAAAQVQVALDQTQAAEGRAGLQARCALALAGEDLDDAGQRVGTVERAGGAAHDLDALDLRQRDGLPGRAARAALGVDAHAVDQQQGVLGIGAAQVEAGAGAGVAVAHDLDAGLAAQQVGQIAEALAFDVGAFDDGHVGQRTTELQR